MKIERDFKKRSEEEQAWLCSETWCEKCGKPDLGMQDPKEFEESGEIFIEGICNACGSIVKSTVHEVEEEGSGSNRLPLVEICLSTVATKNELHLLLKSSLCFPEFYGCNWDAFLDAITDLVAMPKVLKLSGWHELEKKLPSEASALKRCFDEMAAEFPMRAAEVIYA